LGCKSSERVCLVSDHPCQLLWHGTTEYIIWHHAKQNKCLFLARTSNGLSNVKIVMDSWPFATLDVLLRFKSLYGTLFCGGRTNACRLDHSIVLLEKLTSPTNKRMRRYENRMLYLEFWMNNLYNGSFARMRRPDYHVRDQST
jgi:hypothetical protein